MVLTSKDLNAINGGSISATLLNAVSRGITTLFNIGVAIGSSLRRLISGKICRL